jgi:hypothetical protein
MGPSKEGTDPKGNLQAMFGLGAACKRGAYDGTTGLTEWGVPEGGGLLSGADPWWFACEFEAENAQTGHAVGWVAGDIAWLVYTPDEAASKVTVNALIEAGNSAG